MFNKYREQIAYIFFGLMTTIVNWGIFAFLIYLSTPLVISNAISWITAVIFAFFTNRLWVFKSTATGFKNVLNEGLVFLGSRILTGILELGLVPILVLIGLDGLVFSTTGFDAKILVSVAVVIGNYFISKVWVFKAREDKDNLEG